MASVMTTLLLAAPGIPPQQMAQIVAERLQRLDHLRIDYVHHTYVAPLTGPPWDSTGWYQLDDGTGTAHLHAFEHRLTIVRPNALDEFLTDAPEAGYEPINESVFNGRYVSRHLRPDRDGRAHFTVIDWSVSAGVFRWCPVLQVFDVHIQDSSIPHLNLLRLFEQYHVRLVRSAAGVSTYAAAVPMLDGVLTEHYEFDLNERGTTLRFKATSQVAGRPGLPSTREQFVLATAEVNGAELPTEVVVAICNPLVAQHYDAYYFGIDHIVVTSCELCDELTADDVRIEPEFCDSRVRWEHADGQTLRRTYDADGQVVSEELTYGPEPCDEDADFLSQTALRWRMSLPPLALLTGIAVMVVLRAVSRR